MIRGRISSTFGGPDPWDDVHQISLGGIFTYQPANEWSIFGGPVFQFAAEESADELRIENAELQARVKIRVTVHEADEDGDVHEVTKILNTTIGRALLSAILPRGMEFTHINRTMSKKAISVSTPEPIAAESRIRKPAR